ncbi:MAG: hypothetical protein H8D75_01565 [Rhodospirillaceae bacterium]|nr:hypothetical protein [Rhodospirillaceae bacterium]MBL6933665.1 hypothetical protein [Rhodospirillales bacterium]
MPPKRNPLKLNKLQQRTLLLFQELARHPDTSIHDETTGEATLSTLPHAHGDHVHIGSFVVSSTDASGFSNESVWKALERKGLARSNFPLAIILTKEGQNYDTGLSDRLAQPSDH